MLTHEAWRPSLPTKLSFSSQEACREIGCGRTKLHGLISSGQLPARKLGTKVVILREDLAAFLNGLPRAYAA